MQLYTTKIDNKNYSIIVESTINVLQLLEFHGIEVPRFCYHEHLQVAGNCRMCLVEGHKAPKPIVSCATPTMNNAVYFTLSPLADKARENVLEMLLLNHPLDCPICDQGGECDLQENTKRYGSDRSRNYLYNRRQVEDKFFGPAIYTAMTRCIHCTRCVRFIEEYGVNENLKTLGRGSFTEIGTYIDDINLGEFSGNLVDICPVGALMSSFYAMTARPWEIEVYNSVDYTDVFLPSILIYKRHSRKTNKNQQGYGGDRILRTLPQPNNDLNFVWLCDKGRYSFDGFFINRLLEKKNIQLQN